MASYPKEPPAYMAAFPPLDNDLKTAKGPSKPSKLPDRLTTQRNSLLQRLYYFIFLLLLKAFFSTIIFLTRLPYIKDYLPAQPFAASAKPPTFTKTYAIRPGLETRVFVPSAYNTESGRPLPLYLSIHGGGYAFCSARFDDEFAHPFANKNNILVISLSYRSSPFHRFPSQIHDLVAVILEILSDSTLPIDRDRVAIGGFSCGANLALAVSQVLKSTYADTNLIKGVVAFYPVCNYTTPLSVQLASRPEDSGSDPLALVMGVLAWGYLQQGAELTDPLVSTALAERTMLPNKIFVVGCELDLMCHDAQVMAERFAGMENKSSMNGINGALNGAVNGEAKAEVVGEAGWQRNGVRWEMVLDQPHGFDQTPTSRSNGYVVRRRATRLRDDVGQWLVKEAWG
ncbi:hypothetical protein BP5796_02186 [Coleophoma crateriformis]|uniref:Alpha/beta hydrolase fold-3 domain-containing protein n=1 Tax=Coleophoma crateriformis TaxID=565419 RepID=A0A3D8SXX3_9HELO|nr:hypothetical protein BP5796_02186 [Coleophoma crateriformis]